MSRMMLRFLNAPTLILLTAIAVAIQTSLFAAWPLRLFEPDIVLLIVLWCSMNRDFTEGGIITLIVAEIAELHSAAPQGVLLITYMLVYLTFRGASKIFVLATDDGMVRVSAWSSILWRVILGIVLYLLAPNRSSWHHLILFMVPAALIQAGVGLWVFKWLEKFDIATFKNTSSENPDEFQIDNLSI
jgi:hypothetical protein